MIQRLLKRRDVIINTVHVFINKGLNAIVPVLLIPYFAKIFGVAEYGELIYIQSLMTLLMLVTDYGFNVTGTRDVSVHKSDSAFLSNAVSSILTVKALLAAACYLILLLFLLWQNYSGEKMLLYILTYTAFLLQSFIPYWFFQGMNSNWRISLINFASKVVLLLLIFLFVKKNSGLIYVPIIEGISYFISFTFSLLFIFFIFKIKVVMPDWNMIRNQFNAGKHIFFFSVFNWLITGGSIVAMERFSTQEELGYYGTFSRIMYYGFALVQPINLALFPYIAGKSHLPAQERLFYIREAFKIYGAIVIIFLAGSFLLARPAFEIFFDEKFLTNLGSFLPAFYVMVVWICLVMINYFIGLQVLVAYGKDKIYSRYYSINTLIAMIGFISLVPHFKSIGAAVAMTAGELVLFCLLCYFYSALSKKTD